MTMVLTYHDMTEEQHLFWYSEIDSRFTISELKDYLRMADLPYSCFVVCQILFSDVLNTKFTMDWCIPFTFLFCGRIVFILRPYSLYSAAV